MVVLLTVGVLSCALGVNYGDHQDENTSEGKDYHETQDNQPQEEEHVHLQLAILGSADG